MTVIQHWRNKLPAGTSPETHNIKGMRVPFKYESCGGGGGDEGVNHNTYLTPGIHSY